MTGFKTFTYTFTTAGTYVLGVGACNAGDTAFPSGLLVDNFKFTTGSGSPVGPSVVGGGGDSGGGSSSAAGSGSQGGGETPGASRRLNSGHGKASGTGIGLGTMNGGGTAPTGTTGGGNATSGNGDGSILVNTLGGQQTIVAPAPTGSATWSATASLGTVTPLEGAAVGLQNGSSSANGATGVHEVGGLGALDAAFAGALDSGAIFETLA
jgi:hypothetical protein